ncbi:hypothetical protein BH20ACT16_BH20ACT16_12880 [soil metagenome]
MTSVTPLQRLQDLEHTTRSLTARLETLEAHTGVAAATLAAPAPAAVWPSPQPVATAAASAPPEPPATPRPSLEDLLGGRVLAWTASPGCS